MSKLRRSLDKATFRYEDVTVSLDGELGVERDELYKELEAAAASTDFRLGQVPGVEVKARIDALEERMRDALVTFRFRTLAFEAWNAVCAKHPPREGVSIDGRKGYNIVAATKEAAELSGWVYDDGRTEPVTADEWADLWQNLSGGDFDRIWGAITRLNETNGWVGVDFLKKGSTKTPASAGTSVSPEPSE